jgi:TfoX N-terminal domain
MLAAGALSNPGVLPYGTRREEVGVHWEKSPAELADRFGQVMDDFPELQRRKMFGYPAAFLSGNMVTGLHGASWVVRLGTESLAELHSAGGTTFEPMAGRPMKSFAVLPDGVVGDDAALRTWIGRAVEHARSLPPKK